MMSQATADLIEAGLAALSRNSFIEAYEMLKQADEAGLLDAEGLEKLAEAAFWSARSDESLEAMERAYILYLQNSEPLKAGFAAVTLAREYADRQEMAISGAWFGRADKHLSDYPDSREFGYLELMRSYISAGSGDAEAALEHGKRAEDLGRKHGDSDLQGLSLMPQAMALIRRGDVDEGYKLMDEATVAAVSGDLSPVATGVIYCNTIGTCRDLADYRRAAQWTEAAERWCKRKSISGFPGICRVHRAEILSLSGAWLEAEREAVKASEELMHFKMVEIAADSFNEIGMIRLRIGDLEAAEDAFARAHEMGKDPQPGLALLRLAQGKPDAAMSLIRNALSDHTWDRLSRAKLLPAVIEIAEAVRDTEAARLANEEIQQIASDFGSSALVATAASSAALSALLEGNLAESQAKAREARKLWKELGVPYEIARARVTLGRALLAAGELESGELEIKSARVALERLGALPEAKRAGALIDDREEASPKTIVKTFMFTDIVGSTNLVQTLGDEAWENLLRWHDQAMRSIFSDHGGAEIKQVGDGFFVAFDDAESACRCAIAIQQRLASHRREHGFAPQVRIGVHSAPALDREGDYGGRGVHEAARIGAMAEAGEILVSASTLEGLGLLKAGPARTVSLKGISEPVEVCSIDWSTTET